MFHWGKIIGMGLGYFLGGFPGILFGLVLGYFFDKSLLLLKRPKFAKVNPSDLGNLQKEFFVATFAVMGYVAAAGKPDSDDEFDALIGLSEETDAADTEAPDRTRLPES